MRKYKKKKKKENQFKEKPNSKILFEIQNQSKYIYLTIQLLEK